MIIDYQGRSYEFDRAKITVDEWRELKRKYKMTPKGFEDAIPEADPDASTFLYWVMLHQNGQQNLPLNDALKPDIIALNAALAAAIPDDDDPAAGAEPDPTQGSTSPPTSQPPAPSHLLNGEVAPLIVS